MAQTTIEWTSYQLDGKVIPGYTFNSWVGCSKVSPGCAFCYAEGWAKRSGLVQWGNNPRRKTSESYWKQPLKWNKVAQETGVRFRVFCSSLADVFDDQVPPEWREELWQLIEVTPHLDWLLVTKRHAQMLQICSDYLSRRGWAEMPSNIWLGCTVENQEMAVERIPYLSQVPASIRFLSIEPLLEEVRLDVYSNELPDGCGYELLINHVDWLILGGESGAVAKVRECQVNWMRSLVSQARNAANRPAVFVKQLGSKPVFDSVKDHPEHYPFYNLSGKGGEIEEFPVDLQIREFPVVEGVKINA